MHARVVDRVPAVGPSPRRASGRLDAGHSLLAVAVAVAAAASGCFMQVRRPIPPPVVTEGRVTLPPVAPGLPPLILDGPWVTRDGRTCVNGGLVRLLTAAGPIPLQDAHLCVTLSPVSIDGEVTTGFPALGFLARAGVHSRSSRARVRLALGRDLGRIDLGGHKLRAAPDHYYLYLEVASGLEVTIGQASLSGPGGATTLVIDPQEPLIYVAGRLSAPGVNVEGAFGFSPAGRVGLRPAVALRDRRGPIAGDVMGHLLVAGSMPLEPEPVTISGELVLNIDANHDGRTLFEGDAGDFALAGNGAINLGYDKAGFGLELKVGEGSLWFDARSATVAVAGNGGGVLDGTPLAALAPGRSHIDAFYHGVADFALHVSCESALFGMPTRRVRLSLEPSGVRASATMTLPAGLGAVALAGSVAPNGRFALTGTANLTIAGLRMAGARVTFAPTGVTIDGSVKFLGSRFAVHGAVARGHVALSGALALNLAVFKGRAALSLSEAGASAQVSGRACVGRACVALAGLAVDSRGRVCPIFPVIGKRCVKVL